MIGKSNVWRAENECRFQRIREAKAYLRIRFGFLQSLEFFLKPEVSAAITLPEPTG